MVWKPNNWFTLSLYGNLPGVGTASFAFKIAEFFSITIEYAHRKNSSHLNEYPFHDWRYLEHRARELFGKDAKAGRFILESNETGVKFAFRPADGVMLYCYAGFRFKSTYYVSENILDRPSDPDHLANSLTLKAGAVFLFHSGGEGASSRDRIPGEPTVNDP
jgi:hypothetical protein